MVGAAAFQRFPLHADRGGYQSAGRSVHAAKLVWDNYYANHQKKGAFKHLKVADIFMGGGTTLVEGSRLGMQMSGNDLNPVAWFVVKQELANVDLEEVKRLLADIEAEVKPQIMPFYYCDGPNGEKAHGPTCQQQGDGRRLRSALHSRRKSERVRYEGPEIIYTFWAKHGPCQVTGCGHRTPIMTSPVMAVKTLSVKHWEQMLRQMRRRIPRRGRRGAHGSGCAALCCAFRTSFLRARSQEGRCLPAAVVTRRIVNLGKGKNKKVELSLLVHPQWLAGAKAGCERPANMAARPKTM